MKYLELYHNWVEDNYYMSPYDGLCLNVPNDDILQMVTPTYSDLAELSKKGRSQMYWGSDSNNYLGHQFTPLRQNIILLMACLNGEL